MSRSILKLLLGAMLLANVPRVNAFSLIGQYGVDDANAVWQVFEIGYNLPGDIGGPMDLSEEYRWNSPVLTYAYDRTFLDYFGADGVASIEKAIKLLNDLPPVSQVSTNLTEYPLDTRRFNYEATALGLTDLKSFALSALLEEYGLAAAERYVWTLRSRVVINNIPFYTVIKRNFDPITLRPSSYVNGTLYTYTIFQTYAMPDAWEAVEFSVDPYAPSISSVAAYVGIQGGTVDPRGFLTIASTGLFYTGLTRDDVGSLRYLYHRNNLNFENLPLFTTLSSSSSPWGPPPGGTNAVNTALRPGVEKISLVRVEFDSVVGVSGPFTNIYTDTYVTNGTSFQQKVERVTTVPDILFGAADIGVDAAGIPFAASRTYAFNNNSVLNTSGAVSHSGPGTIAPPIEVNFSNLGPWFYNVGTGSGEEDGFAGLVWGSYDGTTNAPIVFPVGTSIQEIENRVLSLPRGGSPWGP